MVLEVSPESASSDVKAAAGEAAWGLRTMFNRPDATLVVRGTRKRRPQTKPYWRDVLNYSCEGALQGVLDEYMLLLREQPEERGDGTADLPRRIGKSVRKTAELQALRVEVDLLDGARSKKRTGQRFGRKTLSSRFAAAFGAAMTEEAAGIHPEVVRRTFNSPFWPWVLVTTSVGQEGLDFHRYCHSVVHWNVPATPVELEQREGRVQRYKSHSVRRNLAATHGPAAMRDGDPWRELYDLGEGSAAGNAVGDFVPEWVFPGPFGIERHVPAPPYSRDGVRFEQVRRARVYYRMVLGQPNPESSSRSSWRTCRSRWRASSSRSCASTPRRIGVATVCSCCRPQIPAASREPGDPGSAAVVIAALSRMLDAARQCLPRAEHKPRSMRTTDRSTAT